MAHGHPAGKAITNQPIPGQPGMYGQPPPGMQGPQVPIAWVPMPTSIPPNCPPGLEFLTTTDHIYVKQYLELFEIITGFETANRYQLLNSYGQRVYLAMEESDCCGRQCLKSLRPFIMHIYDAMNHEVMKVTRPFRMCPCACCTNCVMRAEVEAPIGVYLGVVEQECVCCQTAYSINTMTGERLVSIRRPFCRCDCGVVPFPVVDNSGVQIGEVKKLWGGLLTEMFTDADTFLVTFPVNLDVRIKALMVGACFLLDFMYFEDKNNRGLMGMGAF